MDISYQHDFIFNFYIEHKKPWHNGAKEVQLTKPEGARNNSDTLTNISYL